MPHFWHKSRSIDFCAHKWKTRRRWKQTKIFDWRNGPRPNGTYVTVRTSTWHAGVTVGFVRSSNHIVLFPSCVPWLVPNVWHKSKIIGPSETPWGDFWRNVNDRWVKDRLRTDDKRPELKTDTDRSNSKIRSIYMVSKWRYIYIADVLITDEKINNRSICH